MSTEPSKIHFLAVTCSLADWSTNIQDFNMLVDLRMEKIKITPSDVI